MTRHILTLDELDAIVRGLGFLGIGLELDGTGETWGWPVDRPFLPGDMARLLEQARVGDTVSPDLVRDLTRQLRAQARAFGECADALHANDPSQISMVDAPGLGIKEMRELLDCDLRMTALPCGSAVAEQHATERGELAMLFREAATHCGRAADTADAFRLAKWRGDYERLILSGTTPGAMPGSGSTDHE